MVWLEVGKRVWRLVVSLKGRDRESAAGSACRPYEPSGVGTVVCISHASSLPIQTENIYIAVVVCSCLGCEAKIKMSRKISIGKFVQSGIFPSLGPVKPKSRFSFFLTGAPRDHVENCFFLGLPAGLPDLSCPCLLLCALLRVCGRDRRSGFRFFLCDCGSGRKSCSPSLSSSKSSSVSGS